MTKSRQGLIDRVDEIIGLDSDPVLRNLLITQCYFELSEGLGRVIGMENANWCTYATWASKTAGRFVRKEAVPELLRRLLGVHGVEHQRDSAPPPASGFDLFSPPSDADLGLLDLPDRILEEVSKLIVRGNLKVFAELGPMFARMINLYEGRERPDDARLAELLAPLKPGATSNEGQGLLRDALVQYHNAVLADDPDTKAELILFGNGRVGLHEQMRLQPYIAGSLNAPVRRLMRTFNPSIRLPKVMQSTIEAMIRPAVERVTSLWREIATREMMTLDLPNGVLELGHDLPILPGQPLYPEYLRTIEDKELHLMLAEYGAHDSTAVGSGATDWAHLPARMGYILELFRSRQCDPNLRGRPFRSEHESEILCWRIPTGGQL